LLRERLRVLKNKILLLEDDEILNETIAEYLEDNGFDLTSVCDGYDAYDKIYENSYDLLLLDVKVPSIDGFDLLKELRNKGITTAAIFITSLNSIDDLTKGYDSGCDDYIKKPFELRELLIRINVLLKRDFFHIRNSKIEIDRDIEYDVDANILYIESREQKLNNKETKLLKLFLQNRGQIISHSKIYDFLWSFDETYSENALRTYIKNLRKIIGKDRIVSFKKQGYKFIK
jgi:DNA-binding response OmpR family regulator